MSDSEHIPSGRSGSGVPERLLPLLHEREKFCDELRSLSGRGDGETQKRAAEIIAAYRQAAPLPPEYAEIIDKRFAEAERIYRAGVAAAAEAEKQRAAKLAELEKLLSEHAVICADEKLFPRRTELKKIQKRCHQLLSELDGVDTAKAVYEAAEAQALDRLAQEETAASGAAEVLKGVIAELEKLADADPEEFKLHRPDLDARRREGESAIDPGTPEFAELLHRIRKLWKEANTRLTIHYQALDLARWESYTLKLDLCTELEKTQETADAGLPAAARRLREIRQRWHELGAVPREKQHELGPRYYEYTNALQHRIDEYYRNLRVEQTAAAENKGRLCAEAEALAASTQWNETAEKLKALQTEWKTAPRADRKTEEQLYQRFRTACNRFFDARSAHWKERDAHHAEAAAKKAALCEEAEKLTASEPEEAISKAKQLRGEFLKAGRTGRSETELVRRFDAAMDKIFSTRHEATEQAIAAREAIVGELETLSAERPLEAEKRLRELRSQYQSLPPVPRNRAQQLETRARLAAGKLERAIAETKKRLEQNREKIFIPALRELAAQLTAVRRGEPLPELSADLTGFPKLASLATRIASGSLPDGLDKALQKNTREFREILDELDAPGAGNSPAPDLAAELQAAIIGNSGGGPPAGRRESPEELRRKLFSLGLPEPEELEELIHRLPASE